MQTLITPFKRVIREYYRTHGRQLPWRETDDPYRIWVSEIMLQQTQVERVLPKYEAFIKQFPTVRALASAPLADVLALWVGLGYNRRAQYMHRAANLVVSQGGVFPEEVRALEMLPGVGPYTARAIRTFAYEKHEVFIETNIRTVFIHHFFKNKTEVHDKDILRLIHATLPITHVREWYWALMDYGTYLKKEIGNASRKSKHYKKQTVFRGSLREARGAIVRILSNGGVTRTTLKKRLLALGVERSRTTQAIEALEKDGMIVCAKTCILAA